MGFLCAIATELLGTNQAYMAADLGRGSCLCRVDLTIVLLEQIEVSNIQIHCTPGWNKTIHLHGLSPVSATVCNMLQCRAGHSSCFTT